MSSRRCGCSDDRHRDRDRRRERDRSRQRRHGDTSPRHGRRDGGRPRSRSRSRSKERRRRADDRGGRSPSARDRRREDERRARRDEERQRDEEQREKERAEKEPSCTVLVHGIPLDATEERVEVVAWEASVQAGASMPTGVHFAYDRASQEFRGFAVVEFPHTEAAKLFKEHAGGKVDFDGHTLTIKYHHPAGAPSRSRERDRERAAEEQPSSTIVVRGLSVATTEAMLLDTFNAFSSVKDIRYFPRRGFAFLEFRSIQEASDALKGFDRDCRSKVDGVRVVAHFDKGRQDARSGEGPEGVLSEKQAQANAQATTHLEQMARQQMQQENTTKALSGVNAELWAGYLNSVAQTETVQSSNTFKLDKASGFYLDEDAGLFYDPTTTYFFTLDYKKYFVYDHEEGMLCHVDSEGKKVLGGERRPLPSQRTRDRGGGDGRDRSRGRDGHHRSRKRDRSRSRSRRGHRSRSREHRAAAEGAGAGSSAAGDTGAPALAKSLQPPRLDGAHRPIHFPGGDPLARLAQPAVVEVAPPVVAPPAVPKKKKKGQPESVLGLAPMPRGIARIPGPVIRAMPGPVKVRRSAVAPSDSETGAQSGTGAGAEDIGDAKAAARLAFATFAGAPLSATTSRSRRSSAPKDWICEICLRKFPNEEGLRRHEEQSELHKQNLAKLQEREDGAEGT